MEGTKHGKLIAHQLLDVAIRVQAVRQFIVSQMVAGGGVVVAVVVVLWWLWGLW